MITRIAIHKIIDEHLAKMKYGDTIDIKDGAIVLSLQIKNGKICQTTKEREFYLQVDK
jgi:hypothetical protein